MPTERMVPVVVGVDSTRASAAAVETAAAEASARGVPLVVVHVVSGETRSADRAACLATARRLVASVVGRIGSGYPGLEVVAEVHTGDPATVLVARAAGAALLVVGHGGRRANRRRAGPASGSVAIRVAALASVPVIVQHPAGRPDSGAALRPVLVGAAAAGESDSAVKFAFREAELHRVPLVAEHVWSRADDYRPAFAQADGVSEVEARDRALDVLDEALSAAQVTYPEVSVRRVVRHSLDTAVALTAGSRAASLVVVGAPRHDNTRSAVGATQALIERAGCAVAVVPDP